MKHFSLVMALLLLLCACHNYENTNTMTFITDTTISNTLVQMREAFPQADAELMEAGVRQIALLWQIQDGEPDEFTNFCLENYKEKAADREILFNKLSVALEQFYGTSNTLSVGLKRPTHLDGPEPTEIDYILGSYSPLAHFSDDMFDNKVAFLCALNFPSWTLAKKDSLGADWTRLEWAYARLGDVFTDRVPASVTQALSLAEADAENYIASYNIHMGQLLNDNGQSLFPSDMVLLSHWNLRDEIKSNYAPVPNALEKQRMIYKVMEHITLQTIPQEVINNPLLQWNPYSNEVTRDGKPVKTAAEGGTRYQMLLNYFKAGLLADPYFPQMPTAIERNFEGGMEVSSQEIEELFIHLISSPQVKKVAQMIEQRLGRPLEPFDIWYDGFKSRTTLSEEDLTSRTQKMYPNPMAFKADMPRMLTSLGFSKDKAQELSSKIEVEGARGSGHAWGAVGRWEPSLLRTRIGEKGMDYKGYNIAVHEFGHNVEQTLSLYNVDHYMMSGVPNTAFTEALAFIFQKRDLSLMGYPFAKDDNTTLDIFWGCYEIMGVSLVDMYVWRWLYAHPDATVQDLQSAVLDYAHQVWNQYYEPVLGTHDSPILAIYSHMINSPMYLPNYPFGHIIEYQLEDYFAGKMKDEGKDFAMELERIFTLGRLVPQEWMKQAVGSEVSTEPMLKAVAAIN